MNKEEIEKKAQKADDIVRTCNGKLGAIRKKQYEVIGKHFKAADSSKIENIKKEIEAL